MMSDINSMPEILSGWFERGHHVRDKQKRVVLFEPVPMNNRFAHQLKPDEHWRMLTTSLCDVS